MRAGDVVDPAAGITLERKVGEKVEKGETLAVLHTSREETLADTARMVEAAYSIQPEAPTGHPLLLDVIE
jgi:pyrimidine-nucleoside phosphorylase